MRHLRADELEIHRRIDLAQQVVLRHEFLERHHLKFVLRGHGRLQHHAIKKQKPPTWRGFVSNLNGASTAPFFFVRFFYPVFTVSEESRGEGRRGARGRLS
ncbi:putative non-ribosomal peptide synthase domain protein [Burkholderia pseudomallei]|nr:putative non-ribosomal peptide synthase domain protein [Burkholderia pseudomallei]